MANPCCARVFGRWVVSAVVMVTMFATMLATGVAKVRGDETSPTGKSAAAADPTSRPSRPFSISKQTTHALGPITASGTVDYVGALNLRYGEGVKPEENAAIPVLRAIGPLTDASKDAALAKARAALGIEALPAGGRYFRSFDEFERAPGGPRAGNEPVPLGNEADDRAAELEDRAAEGPWKAADLPRITAWLAAVDQPLDEIARGLGRPKWYVPLVSAEPAGEALLIGVLLPDLNHYRAVANAFRIRAMMRLGAGDADGFSADVVAAVRLGRHLSHGATLVQRLVGYGCSAVGLEAARKGAISGRLEEAKARALLAALRSLPAALPISDAIDGGERYMLLDALGNFAVYGPQEMSRITGGPAQRDAARPRISRPWVRDWDSGMRRANGLYDRLVAGMNLPTHAQQTKALEGVAAEVEEIHNRLGGNLAFLTTTIEDRLIAIILPSVGKSRQTQTRLETEQAMTEATLALAAFKAKTGKYPAELNQLVPGYLPAAPIDGFSAEPLRYKQEGNGFMLYSVGPNMIDENGEAGEDRRSKKDDIAVWVSGRAGDL